MVPADDEHKSANEADSNTSTKEREPGRLTPMPDWLMKWWIPFAVAGLLLIICTPIAFWWGGHFHWPSADGISVCITIAGAALAVSTWQQRNNDNAFKEQKQAQAQRELETDRQEREQIRLKQIERDEYWKRREQIYQLLGSRNAGLRLGAIELLAELADSAAHSTLLNKNAEQRLQRHIIDTLCLQLRHEGLAHETEGSLEEHSSIQEEILNQIAKRIHEPRTHSSLANWRAYNIDLSHTTFYTPVILHSLHIAQSIDVRNSTFHSHVTITDSTLNSLHWAHASFLSQLNISDCTVIHDRFPDLLKEATFSRIIFKLIKLEETEHQLQLSEHKKEKSKTNIITFDNECRLYGRLKIITKEGYGDYSSENITIANSTLDSIEITSEQGHTNNFHAILTISGCKILESLHIHNINYWFPAAQAHTEWELMQMSDQDIQDLQHELYGMYSPFLGDDPAYTDATYTQQSAIYIINNSFSDALLEHNPQFESVNGYEHGEGCQSEKFITFKDNATLSRMPLRISEWFNDEDAGEDSGDNRRIELLPTANIEYHHLT